jgi:transketolase
LWGDEHAAAFLVSSGRGVHEALAAARTLDGVGIRVGVVDMPSMDQDLVMKLYGSGKPVIVEEQNNGWIWAEMQKVLLRALPTVEINRFAAINTLDESGRPRFIHSATYPQLLEIFGLDADHLAARVKRLLGKASL